MLCSFLTSAVIQDPTRYFPDSSAKAPETSDGVPEAEDNPIPNTPKYESTADKPQSPSGNKSSPNLSKDPRSQNASLGTASSGLSPMENPHSSEPAESPKTTPPNNPCNGISSAGEAPIGGDSAQPQPKSLPRRTPLVKESLANDLNFIHARFHIGRFITVVVDTKADRLNTEALHTELDSASTRINVSGPCIIVQYSLCSILTSPFRSGTTNSGGLPLIG
jgi:hypothetical protein